MRKPVCYAICLEAFLALILAGCTPMGRMLGLKGASSAMQTPPVVVDAQPQGALSGVILYCGAGHGWTLDSADRRPTDGDSGWWTQRGITNGLVEDYGNIDQLNLFAEMAWRAGATIVPFRPLGHQTREVVMDNGDPGVEFNGLWSDVHASVYYGNANDAAGYRVAPASADAETATARYTPTLSEAGIYPVYTWADYGADRLRRQRYRIRHTGGVTEVFVNHRRVGRGWVWLGNYFFEAGRDGYVEISNRCGAGDGGVVVADAIRFGVGMGDVNRGSGVSGQPRELEAALYWIERMLGQGAPGDVCARTKFDDYDANVGSPARMSAWMNNEADGEYADRIYLGFHSNAGRNGSLRGAWTLFNNEYTTTDQERYAQVVCEEIENEMERLDEGVAFPEDWNSTLKVKVYGSNYGEIRSGYNNNEMNATIAEVAFHDNAPDAEILKDPKARRVMARAALRGVIRYLNEASKGRVPAAYPPDAPTHLRVKGAGGGKAVLSWKAPERGTAAAEGDPPAGYVVYRSEDGRGFAAAARIEGGETTQARIQIGRARAGSGAGKAGGTVFFRVAAWNSGGESDPSPVVAVRNSGQGRGRRALIVDGFDRQDAGQSPIVEVASHLGSTSGGGGRFAILRPERMNPRNSTVAHAIALADNEMDFDSCESAAVSAGLVSPRDYALVAWACGTDGPAGGHSLDERELAILREFVESGGALLLSGSEIGSALSKAKGSGAEFSRDILKSEYKATLPGASRAAGVSGSVFEGVSEFGFGAAQEPGTFETPACDWISPLPGARAALKFAGEITAPGEGAAAIQAEVGEKGRVLYLAFPFEASGPRETRALLMALALNDFLLRAPR